MDNPVFTDGADPTTYSAVDEALEFRSSGGLAVIDYAQSAVVSEDVPAYDVLERGTCLRNQGNVVKEYQGNI